MEKMGKTFDLNLRVVDCETGKIVPGCGFNGPFEAAKDKLKLWEKHGGVILFCFKTNRNCYIYVFNHGTSGRVFPLIPNERLTQSNYILAGEKTRIPAVGGFPVGGNSGTEKIFVIASMTQIGNLDEIARGLVSDPGGNAKGLQHEVELAQTKSLTRE